MCNSQRKITELVSTGVLQYYLQEKTHFPIDKKRLHGIIKSIFTKHR